MTVATETSMLELVRDLHMENRSLCGPGFNRGLDRIAEEIPLTVHRVPSGSEVWGWPVPNEWDVNKAWIVDGRDQNKCIDYRDHPLHVWSYSLPFQGRVTHQELLRHITTDPSRPDVIPFDYRYYKRDWGFSLAHNQLGRLDAPFYDVLIDTRERPGFLKVGEHVIHGQTDDSILIVSHLCHPGQANDDLSGVTVAVELAKRLAPGRLTVRFLFVPERIGTIAYLAQNEHLIPLFKYGAFLDMVGNDQPFTFQHSYRADSAVDRAARFALRGVAPYREAVFGEFVVNDEAVLDGNGVEIPTVSLSRAGAAELPYPEYHSSADTPDILSEARLEETVRVMERIVSILDRDRTPSPLYKGTPHLSKHGLWVDWRDNLELSMKTGWLLRMIDGKTSVSQLAAALELPFDTVHDYLKRLAEADLVYYWADGRPR